MAGLRDTTPDFQVRTSQPTTMADSDDYSFTEKLARFGIKDQAKTPIKKPGTGDNSMEGDWKKQQPLPSRVQRDT